MFRILCHPLQRSTFFATTFLVCCVLIAHAAAQSYPLVIKDAAIENPYVLHAKDWPPTLGLLNFGIMRTNAGERWFQIEPALHLQHRSCMGRTAARNWRCEGCSIRYRRKR
jgi:hypothetical protein